MVFLRILAWPWLAVSVSLIAVGRALEWCGEKMIGIEL